MNVSYKRDMAHNYMVPEMAETVGDDDYRVHMLMENQIQGLLPCSLRRVNGQSLFFYDITSRQSMERVYGKRRMNAEDLRSLLGGLHRALRELKKYLLDMDRIVLDPQMIYMDIESREPLFCYLPCYERDLVQSFRELAMYLLERLDDTDEQAVLLGYEIYRRAGEHNDSLENILQSAGAPAQMREMDNEAHYANYAQMIHQKVQKPYVGTEAGKDKEMGMGMGAGVPGAFGCPPGELPLEMPDFSWGDEEPKQKKKQKWPISEKWEKKEKRQKTQGQQHQERQERKERKERKERQAKQQAQKTQTQRKRGKQEAEQDATGRWFLIVCFAVAIALLAVAAWLWKLTVTQIGGVSFLLIAILVYGFTLDEKKKKEGRGEEDAKMDRAMEEFQDMSDLPDISDMQEFGMPMEADGQPMRQTSYQDSRAGNAGYQSLHGGEGSRAGNAGHQSFYGGEGSRADYRFSYQGSGAGNAGYQSSYGGEGSRADYGFSYQGKGADNGKHPSSYQGMGSVRYQTSYQGGGSDDGSHQGAWGDGANGAFGYRGETAGAAGGAGSAGRFSSHWGEDAARRKSRLGDTGILYENADKDSNLILVSKNPRQQESIVLEKDSYVVGKLSGQADIILSHPSVSRVHAKIDRLGKEYYLCDLNSTNGTYVNGRRLMVNESVSLAPSDEIAFARESFQVVCY